MKSTSVASTVCVALLVCAGPGTAQGEPSLERPREYPRGYPPPTSPGTLSRPPDRPLLLRLRWRRASPLPRAS